MTNEQILEELKKLKANATIHTSVPTAEEQTNVNSEVESLDETIADYNEQIAALEAKIADPNNYQYNYYNEERDFTIELLQESFENQLEVMDREDAEYKSLQDIATSIFTDYNLEIQSLNLEIEAIERRFRKNDVAVKKNIGIRLTDQELTNLQADLESKKARLAVCEEMKTKYVEDLRNYGELITVNNHKREIVIGKQNSLNRIIENKKNNSKTIDNFKLQSDKDELARLKAGVAALKSRKDYITYNPSEEIDKLIAMVSAGKGIETSPVEDTVAKEEKKNDEVSKAETLINAYNQEFEPKENTEDKEQDLGVVAPIVGNNEELEKEEKDKDATIIPTPVPVSTPEMEDISSHSDVSKEEPEEEKSEEDKIKDAYVVPNELDEEREAEIEDAKEELKKKKKDNFFKKHWKKFVAVGLGVVVIAALAKGCHKTTDLSKTKTDTPKKDSYSQSDDGIIDNNQNDIDNKYEFENPTIKPSPGNTTVTPSTPSTPTVNPDTKTPDTPSTPDPTPSTPDKPDVPDTPVTPDKPEEPTVEKETVELEAGEKLASLDDILKGNTGKENVISHGDEVGKKTNGAELKDYTKDGKAQIDLDKKDDTSKDTSTVQDPDEWKKALEDFMGGEITFDNNQWLDEMTNGKTR